MNRAGASASRTRAVSFGGCTGRFPAQGTGHGITSRASFLFAFRRVLKEQGLVEGGRSGRWLILPRSPWNMLRSGTFLGLFRESPGEGLPLISGET